MIVWLDAQLSPYLARWLSSEFDVEAKPVRELGLRDAKDREIFLAAREAGAIVFTKDSDFVLLLEQLGPLHKFCGSRFAKTSRTHAFEKS